MQPAIPPSFRTETRVFVLGILSVLYGVFVGGLWSLMALFWVSQGFHGNLFDLGTGLMAILAVGSGTQILSGIGLLLQQPWAVRLTYGICAALLICSALGLALNLCLDSEVVAIPIVPLVWSIVLNFVLRSRKLAKSLRAPRN